MSALFGETINMPQDNGPLLPLVIFGDEFYARYETRNGFTVVYDEKLGVYCFAMLADGRFVSSGVPVAKGPPVGLLRHLKESKVVRNAKFEKRYSRMRGPEFAARTLGPIGGLLEGRRVSDGDVRGLTILVEFQDVRTDVTSDDVDDLLNGQNYARNGNYSSAREYFRTVSTGKLNYSNTVVGPVRLRRDQSYYKTHLLVREALDLAIDQFGIDLHDFDSQDEGFVDALNFMYAGRTVYDGDLWPHNYHLSLQYGDIQTYFYLLTSLGRSPIDLSIGTFCHENGHLLCRWPDLYDYGERDGDFEKSAGMGSYCLMGAGNHLNSGRTPSPPCAYLRYLVDWHDEVVDLRNSAAYRLQHGDYGKIHIYQTSKPNEFFIAENRTQRELDEHLPSSGLAIYHCDTEGSNEWQGGSADRHYQCGVEQADGSLDLENNRNRGDQGDLFQKKDGVAFSDATTPASLLWDGSDSGLVVADISGPGRNLSFSVGRGTTTRTITSEVAADLLIPDNQPQGVQSAAKIDAAGTSMAIRVGVDVTHPWIGDLEIRLISPDGSTVLLRPRQGRDGDDIHEVYDSASHQELAKIVGGEVSGDWQLHIRDLARRDTGRLNRWSLELDLEAAEQTVEEKSKPRMDIPDQDPAGVTDVISIDEEGEVTRVVVDVAITHSWIGDLSIQLSAPSGQAVTLLRPSGRAGKNLARSFSPDDVLEMSSFVGEPLSGDWTLRVADTAAWDEGKLKEWKLKIDYE